MSPRIPQGAAAPVPPGGEGPGGAGAPGPGGAAGVVPPPGPDGAGRLVKCVVWDLDNTLLAGTFLESGDSPPAADPGMAALLAELDGRGILHAVATRNPPEAAAHAAVATGREFAAVECGWGRKSAALTRIAGDLGIGVDTLAFVDDDPYERAEVSSVLPEVLVLSPEEVAGAAQWPEFRPPVLTPEARARGRMYAQRRRREQARRAFGGSREEFLRSAGTVVTIGAADPADVPRLHELTVRTRRFNSVSRTVTREEFLAMIAAPGADVVTVRLRDAFGDDGLVGACVVERGGAGAAGVWTVALLMMSCRAMGRGVIDALLAWLAGSAARQGAAVLRVPCLLSDRNVPLRLALAAAGLRAEPGGGNGAVGGDERAGEGTAPQTRAVRAVFRRGLDGALPSLPGWVRAPGAGAVGGPAGGGHVPGEHGVPVGGQGAPVRGEGAPVGGQGAPVGGREAVGGRGAVGGQGGAGGGYRASGGDGPARPRGRG